MGFGICAAQQQPQQRLDSRRLFWTGSFGADWSGSSWKTSGSFIACASSGSALWISDPAAGAAPALPSAPFRAGDVAVFDSAGDNPAARTVNIGADGVTVADVVVSGAGNHVFTGGAITADAASIAPGSPQFSGTGIAPGGRLIKLGTGELTLSSTAAHHFKGGIQLADGTLVIADTRALGDNSISLIRSAAATNTGNITVPAVVTDAAGGLLRDANGLAGAVTLRVPAGAAGLDITGDVFLLNQKLNLDIEGDTTISGRLHGSPGAYNYYGYFAKTGAGDLILTGTNNWFYGTSTVAAGRLVITSAYAIGAGDLSISPGASLVIRGASGTMPMSFVGGGGIVIQDGGDITFNWHNGVLIGGTAANVLSGISVTGASRFSAIASGTFSGVLGGATSIITVNDRSTLVIGREGLDSRGTVNIGLPMSYPIIARGITLTGSSTLVLNPNAHLQAGSLIVTDGSVITFGASGVSRVHYIDGTDPLDLDYSLPEGFSLITNILPVNSGVAREYVVVNQGANPLKDIAMTAGALDALHDTLSARFHEHFLHPPARQNPSRGRQWVNSAWMRYLDSRVDYETGSTISQPGHSGRVNGLVIGLDGTLDGRFLAGLHGGAGQNNLDTTNHTALSSKQKFLGLHLAGNFGRFHLAADASTGRAHTDALRHETTNLTRGQWETAYYSGAIETGFLITPWKNGFIRPLVSARYMKFKITGHYERGPSPLVVADFDDALAQAVFGARLGQTFRLFHRDFAAGLTLARKHTLLTPRETLDTHYYDSPGTSVSLERGDYYDDTTAIGVSLRAFLTRHTLAGLAYDHETGPARTRDIVTLTAGYTW